MPKLINSNATILVISKQFECWLLAIMRHFWVFFKQCELGPDASRIPSISLYWHLFYAFFGSSSFISLLSVLDSSFWPLSGLSRNKPGSGISLLCFFFHPLESLYLEPLEICELSLRHKVSPLSQKPSRKSRGPAPKPRVIDISCPISRLFRIIYLGLNVSTSVKGVKVPFCLCKSLIFCLVQKGSAFLPRNWKMTSSS